MKKENKLTKILGIITEFISAFGVGFGICNLICFCNLSKEVYPAILAQVQWGFTIASILSFTLWVTAQMAIATERSIENNK